MTKRELVSWALVAGLAASGGVGWWKAAQVAAPVVAPELPLPGGQDAAQAMEQQVRDRSFQAWLRGVEVGRSLERQAWRGGEQQAEALDRRWRQHLLDAGVVPRTEPVPR